ncbi:MAG: hypothetical protein ACYDH9_23610 [Limisphaerales bacterium]
MLTPIHLFALGSGGDLFNPAPVSLLGKGAGLVMQEVLWILAAGLGLLLILMAGAKYFRRSRHHQHDHHHRHHGSDSADTRSAPAAADSEDPDDSGPHRHRHRRRRRRRDHRPRNPTLAETGGLPPERPDEPPSATPP